MIVNEYDQFTNNIINEENMNVKNVKNVDLGTNVCFKQEFKNLRTESEFDTETIKDCIKLNNKLMNLTKREKSKLVNQNIIEKEKCRMNMIINTLNVGSDKNEANKFYNILTNNKNNWDINMNNIEKRNNEKNYKRTYFCEEKVKKSYNITDKIKKNIKPIQFDQIKKMVFEKERKFRERIETSEKIVNSNDYDSKSKEELISIINQKNEQIEFLTFTIEKMRYKIRSLESNLEKEIESVRIDLNEKYLNNVTNLNNIKSSKSNKSKSNTKSRKGSINSNEKNDELNNNILVNSINESSKLNNNTNEIKEKRLIKVNEIKVKNLGNKEPFFNNNKFKNIHYSPNNDLIKIPFNEILIRNSQNIQIFNMFKEILNKSQKLLGS